MSTVTTGTDSINGGLPVLPEGLRWSVFRDRYNVLNVTLEQERRVFGFIKWKVLYEEAVTHYMDEHYKKNQTVEEIKINTIKVARELLARYNKRQAHEDAKREAERLFKEAL